MARPWFASLGSALKGRKSSAIAKNSSLFEGHNWADMHLNGKIQRGLMPMAIAAGVVTTVVGANRAQPDRPGNIARNGNLETSAPGSLGADGSMVFAMHKRGKA